MAEKVSFKKCSGYDLEVVTSALRSLLDSIGGMSSYVKPGDKVLLKPNLLASAPVAKAVTTHPAVIYAVVELVKECQPTLIHIRDNPIAETPDLIAKAQELESFHPEAELLPFADYRPVANSEGGAIRSFSMAHEVFGYDAVINLPKFKTHCQMTMTLAVKNWFGLIETGERIKLHLRGGYRYTLFADLLLDICLASPPGLSILDGISGMEGNGPAGGEVVQSNFLAASSSPFALDAAVVELSGHDPDLVPTVKRSRDRGLLPQYEVVGDSIELAPVKLPAMREISFLESLPGPIQTFVKNILLARPRLNSEKCLHCQKCYNLCPPKAIAWSDKNCPEIDQAKCIRCYCCIEACPAEALEPYESPLKMLMIVIRPVGKIVLKLKSIFRS